MKYLISIMLFASFTARAEVFPYDTEVAAGYARTAVLEWSVVSGYEIDREALTAEPEILSGTDQDGRRIVMVLFAAGEGTYETSFTMDKDGYMEKQNVGHWAYDVEQIKKDFLAAPYLPGLLE